jgi:hypothetical protein
MDPTIFGRMRLIWEWYSWGVFVAFVLALAAVFWVFFDSQRRGQETILWKVLAVVSLILIVPSVILRIDPSLGFSVPGAIMPLGYLGLLAGIGALVTLFAYTLGIAVVPQRICPDCGRPLDPSWDRCPYCAPQPVIGKSTGGAGSPLPGPLPYSPPPMPAPLRTQPPAQPLWQAPGQPATAPAPVQTEILYKPVEKLAWLVQSSGARAGKEYNLGPVTNIGRDASQNDIVVDEPSVSRQHARIRLEDGCFVLYDLASSNKTCVNGQEIQKHPLLDGDMVAFGRAEFTFLEVK